MLTEEETIVSNCFISISSLHYISRQDKQKLQNLNPQSILSWWWLYIVWMLHLAIKQFEVFVEWLNEIYALISVHISH